MTLFRRQSDENYYGEFDENGYRIARRDLIGGTLNERFRQPTQRSYSPNREGTEANIQEFIEKQTESTIEAIDSTLSESTNYYRTQIKYRVRNIIIFVFLHLGLAIGERGNRGPRRRAADACGISS